MLKINDFHKNIVCLAEGGKSGAFIFATPDRKYVIKLMNKEDIGLLNESTFIDYYKRIMS